MQQYPLLATKLFRPTPGPSLVSRSRLMQQLNSNFGPDGKFTRKLTLVCAPAGFGKTTLIADWMEVQKHANSRCNVAWFSLDEVDSDPVRFLHYVIAAMRQLEVLGDNLGEGVLNMLQTRERPSWEIILTPVINAMASLDQCVMLVLDDLHLVEGQAVYDILSFLIEYMPERMHLVLISRMDPPLSLSRLRVRRKLTELRAADLRFTREEIQHLIHSDSGVNITDDDLSALEQRTEGWIAGLQLAVLSMRGHEEASDFITSFTGSHRFVLDYLIEEVLEQQSQEIQRFLLQTSILDRLCADLCDAVTGKHNGQDMLSYLERANLFLIPLDNDRHWYRYHHLFADLLRNRLNQSELEATIALHIQASIWFQNENIMDEAISHALKAGDTNRALNLADLYADELWTNGQSEELMRLLQRLPLEGIYRSPRLTIYQLWFSYLGGDVEQAEKGISVLETLFSNTCIWDDDIIMNGPLTISNLEGRFATVRMLVQNFTGDLVAMSEYAQTALAKLSTSDSTWMALVQLTLGDLYGFQANMQAAYETRSQALRTCKNAGEFFFAILAAGKLALSLREQGDLQETIALCEQELDVANKVGLNQLPMCGLIQTLRVETLFEMNQINQVDTIIRKDLELAFHSINGLYAGWILVCLARVYFSTGKTTQIDGLADELKAIDEANSIPPWIMSSMARWQLRVDIVQENHIAVNTWLENHNIDETDIPEENPQIIYFALYDYMLLARILLMQGETLPAISLLSRLEQATEKNGRITSQITILLIQALALNDVDDSLLAFSALEKALDLAEPRGFVRIFTDEGVGLAKLLYEALTQTSHADYVKTLLAAFPESPAPEPDNSAADTLIEPLSDREVEVLQLMAAGMTNPEIAQQLYLSKNTVKVHTRNIYGKLGVNNRTQAANRAKTLGLIN